MVIGEDLYIAMECTDENSDEEVSEDEDDFGDYCKYITSEISQSSLEKYEEDINYNVDDAPKLMHSDNIHIQKIKHHCAARHDLLFKDIITTKRRVPTKAEFRRGVREVAIRLYNHLSPDLLEDTMLMFNYFILLAPKNLTSFYTGVVLKDIYNKVKGDHAPETLEFLMRRSKFLTRNYRKDVFSLIAHDINIIKGSSEIIRRFVTHILMTLPITTKLEDMKYVDNIIPFLHKIYMDLKDDPVAIENITTPTMVEALLNLLGGEVVYPRDKHTIIEILAIMACNSKLISHALMKAEALLKLIRFDHKYGNCDEAFKMNLTTLVWAILPSLPEQQIYNLDEEYIKPTSLPIWWKEVGGGLWVPFVPALNYTMECKFELMTEFNYVESGTIYTIDFRKMLLINESTSEPTAIIREYNGYHEVLNLKKSKQDSDSAVVSNCFIRFAYTYLCSRSNCVYSNSPEEFRCWQGLSSLFECVTDRQHFKVLLPQRPKPNEMGWLEFSIGELVHAVQEKLYHEGLKMRIIALQITTTLMRRSPEFFDELFENIGIMSTIRLIARMDEVLDDSDYLQISLDSDAEERNCLKEQAKAFLNIYKVRKGIRDFQDLSLEVMLERLMSSSSISKQNDRRRSSALNYFLNFLTDQHGSVDRSQRLREFLHMFANIPLTPQSKKPEISNELIVKLFLKLDSIVSDFMCSHASPWSQELSEEKMFNSGLKTIGILAKKPLKISLYMATAPTSSTEFRFMVYPFTTIQYLEYHVLSKTKANKSEERAFGDDSFKVELYMNGDRIPSEITVYEAIRRFEIETNKGNIFKQEHRMGYIRKCRTDCLDNQFHQLANPLDRYLRERTPFKNIPEDVRISMQLIDILYGLNKHWTSLYPSYEHQSIFEPRKIVSYDFDSMVHSALRDPFNVLLGKSPVWVECLLENCPFRLVFQNRIITFRVLRLDRRSALQVVMELFFSVEPSIPLPNVKIRRSHILNDIHEVLRRLPSCCTWNVAFEGEIGAGQGLTRELFTTASRHLQKADLRLWTESESTDTGYVHVKSGLYPVISRGVSQERHFEFVKSSTEDKFVTIGMLLGKALLEKELLDLPLALPVFKWILKQERQLTLDDIKHVNPYVHRVMESIQRMVEERDRIVSDPNLSPKSKEDQIRNININGETVGSYDLYFVVPAYDIEELIPGGANIQVTLENAFSYIEKLKEYFLYTGVEKQMNALRYGLNSMINLDHLQIFHPEELQEILCGKDDDEYWSIENLIKYIVVEDFKSYDDEVIHHLFDILSSSSGTKRRLFLEFVTGSSHLPVGGFRSLNPHFTIKCSGVSYPHAQTCFHTLCLPSGMSKFKMEQFIDLAITDGLSYFGLA